MKTGIKLLFLAAAVVLAVVGYFSFSGNSDHKSVAAAKLELIERTVQEQAYYDDEGKPIPAVLYIDRRNPNYEVRYLDEEQNGTAEQLESRPPGASESKNLMVYRITEEEERAERFNREILRNGYLDKAVIFYPEESIGASLINDRYHEVRQAYLKLHPGLNLPENQPFKPNLDQAKIVRFLRLLVVHNAEEQKVHGAKGRKAEEIAELRSFLAFQMMRRAFNDLSRFEQRAAVYQAGTGNVPSGMKIDGGPPVKQLFGISLVDSSNPTRNFREYLADAYMEIDYMSAWSISGTKEEKQVEEQFDLEMKAKGLDEPKP